MSPKKNSFARKSAPFNREVSYEDIDLQMFLPETNTVIENVFAIFYIMLNYFYVNTSY